MSADNFVGVFCSYDDLGRKSRWYVAEGMMHNLESEDSTSKWKKEIIKKSKQCYHNRETALVVAHEMVNCPVVEYGVLEV